MTDRLALLEFKAKITSDPFGIMSSWNDSIHFCQWRGITCGHRHQRVTMLDLKSLKLVGSISPLHNEIPLEIGRLHKLQVLRLQNNTINGKIPINLASCTNLNFLQVSYNLLTGEIPSNLGTLSKLRFFAIPQNNVTGSIPNSFGNMSSLEVFSAFFNQLGGSIPDSFGQLTKLTLNRMNHFHISNDNLGNWGENDLGFLCSLTNDTYLTSLHINGNNFGGELPKCIGNLSTTLISLTIYQVIFPLKLECFKNYNFLALNNNNFYGNIPSKIGKLQKLQLLALNTNNFYGNSPTSIGNLTFLTYFGSISPQLIIGRLFSPSFLSLFANQFTGVLPMELGNLKNLEGLDVSKNKLFGKILDNLGSYIKLEYLYMESNLFQGTIPPSFESLRSLQLLYLSNNNLIGQIPKFLVFVYLEYLNLSYNNFEGEVPIDGVFKNISATFLEENSQLCGGILEKKRQDNTLSDSGNLLLNLSYQSLLNATNGFGSVYKGILDQGRQTDIVAIKVFNLLHHGASKSFIAEMDEAIEEPKNLSLLQSLNIAIDVANALDYLHHHCQTPIVYCDLKPRNILIDDEMIGHVGEFGLANFLFDVIEDYSIDPSSFVGYGMGNEVSTYGDVYSYGILLIEIFIGQRPVAKIFQDSLNLRDFVKMALSEQIIDIVDPILLLEREEGQAKMIDITHNEGQKGSSKIQECLIVILGIGVACSAELPRERMNMSDVVIELQSTRQKLLGTKASSHRTNNVPEKPKNLNLLQRLKIIIDVANALDYLHHHCHTPIIHCDLKPSNVLLDDEMIGHVSDFGLARFLFEDTHDCFTNQSSSIVLRGTMEYRMVNEMSILDDVYSYGILLLEMFTGKWPTNNMFKDGLNLHDFVKTALPDQVIDILDPNLLWEREDEMTWLNDSHNQNQIRSPKIQECFILIFGIGVSCSREFARERMNMSDVVNDLHSIKEKLLGTRIR
ncbi:hypothetical protein ACB098_11G147400 [Castanea mollissima]